MPLEHIGLKGDLQAVQIVRLGTSDHGSVRHHRQQISRDNANKGRQTRLGTIDEGIFLKIVGVDPRMTCALPLRDSRHSALQLCPFCVQTIIAAPEQTDERKPS